MWFKNRINGFIKRFLVIFVILFSIFATFFALIAEPESVNIHTEKYIYHVKYLYL